MLKKLQLIVLLILCVSSGLLAQEVVLSDEFDNGDGKWTSGWIDAATTTVAVSIDTTGKLSGKNSYKLAITNGGVEIYRIQRNANCPLVPGYQYTVSFMAVADSDAVANVLFEIAGDPYTKRLNDTITITSTAQTFTFTMTSTENVPDNQLKLHFGSQLNNGRTIWIDKISVTRIPDPTLVSKWGFLGGRIGDWQFMPGELGGAAGIGGDAQATSAWVALRGGFNEPVTATTDKAILVTGNIEFVGSGIDTWSGLRYGLFMHDSAGTLNTTNVDSTRWSGSESYSHGYMFTPISGSNNTVDGNTEFIRVSGNYISSSSGSGPIRAAGLTSQKPRGAVADAGVYSFAFSVQPLSNGTKEVRFYLIKGDPANSEKSTYYFGGSFIDTTSIAPTFNGIVFAVHTNEGSGSLPDLRAVKVTNVRVDLGKPFAIPIAPWQNYYIDLWGKTDDAYGLGWPILNDSTTLIGDASIGGYRPMNANSNGASLRGGFGQDISISADKAIILNGQMEFVGGDPGSVYTALRFALTYQDSATLKNQYTDSAKWVSTKKYYGYEFTPKSGSTDYPNGGGGAGPVWTVIDGAWASTYSNGGAPYGDLVQPAPGLAPLTAGIYNWAVSVQQINDTTNEVRYYIEKKHAANVPTEYWFGVSVKVPAVTNKFNNIAFWTKEGEHTQFNIIAAKIDLGNPITIPTKPFSAFYVPAANWGFLGANRTGGWKLTQGDLDGNVSIGGTGPVAADAWAAVRGSFGDAISLSDLPDTALVVTGKMQFVGGGFDGWSGLRLGLFYSDSAGVLDSTANGMMWSGSEGSASGYLFCPNSGTNDNPTWSGPGGNGSIGGVVNGTWLSTNGGNNYILANHKTSDVAGEATYDFKLTFKAMGSGKTAIGFSIKSSSYMFEGSLTDSHNPLATTKFNSINFTVEGTNATTTALNITDVKVDFGAPIITSVEGDANGDGSLPITYSLSQNYPNPFNPTTTIEFALPKTGDVKLVVYDILGREVKTLVNGNLTAGYHSVTFNASNLASGIYFYSIKAGDFTNVKKLILLK